MGHLDRKTEPAESLAGLFPRREEPMPLPFVAALIPTRDDDAYSFQESRLAVVLEWHPPKLEAPPGRPQLGFYEVALRANDLEAAVKAANALNGAEA